MKEDAQVLPPPKEQQTASGMQVYSAYKKDGITL